MTIRNIVNLANGCMILALAAGAASASTSFDFSTQTGNSGSGMGDSLSFASGGITITETAWWLSTSSPTSGTTFEKAEVDAYNGYGLGVCDPTEGSNCGSPSHQVTNDQGVDFILLTFSSPVSLQSLTNNLSLLHYANVNGSSNTSNADIEYWTPSGALTTSTTLGSLGTGTDVNNGCTTAPCTVTDTVTGGTSVSELLIAAQPGADSNDVAFKLAALTVNSSASSNQSSTPEPSTEILLGSGLLAASALMRRRNKNADR